MATSVRLTHWSAASPARLHSRPEAGGQPSRTFNENFDGDFGGVFYTRRIITGFTVVPRVVGFNQRVVGFNNLTTLGATQTTTATVFTANGRVDTVTNTHDQHRDSSAGYCERPDRGE